MYAFAGIYLAFWFWAFSFAYSSSFFAYNQHSRIPAFIAALAGAALILISFVAQWRSRRGLWNAFLRHAVGVLIALCPLGLTLAILVRAPEPWRPSADDAMGMGINLILLAGLGVCSVTGLAVGLWLRNVRRSARDAGS
jgi:hypothetical protein